MKKSSYVALLLGAASTVLFALGMCMALLPEWNSLKPGVLLGCAGLILGFITLFVWRKMEHKAPIRITRKVLLTVLLGAAGVLALGMGMCFSMVWDKMVPGILIGLVGILVLLSMVPLVKGIE